MTSRVLLGVTMLLASFAAAADETSVRRMMEQKMHGTAIENIRKAPWGELYEAVVRGSDGRQIFYVDSGATVIIAGQAIDARTGENLTEARQRTLDAIEWSSLPFNSAVTTIRGNGRRKIAIFSDPNCLYCKRFEKELAKVDNITVHIFLYPVIRPESVTQAKAVWCSKDRAKAWNDLMLRDIQPSAKPDCDTPVERLVALGRSLGANGTPTWFLPSGEKYTGAQPMSVVVPLLEAASQRK